MIILVKLFESKVIFPRKKTIFYEFYLIILSNKLKVKECTNNVVKN